MKTLPLITKCFWPKSEAGDTQTHSQKLVALLLEEEPLTKPPIMEASVHASRRSRVYTASYTGPNGGQVWKTTGLTDYDQAQRLAQSWELRARAQRAKLGRPPRKPGTRVGPGPTGTGLTQKEVARILHMSERGVREIERRAFQKLRNQPLLRQLWHQYLAGELDEDCRELAPAEIASLFDVAQTPEELRLIEKVLAMNQT